MTKELLELKVRCSDLKRARSWMAAEGRKIWEGRQMDTYFPVGRGRLKLRQVDGEDRGTLIYYTREDVPGPKRSEIQLVEVPKAGRIRRLLGEALGVWVVVEKRREVYRWGEVQVHLDVVGGLGTFVEFEREIREDGEEVRARKEFDYLMGALGLREDDLVATSYSDLLMDAGQ